MQNIYHKTFSIQHQLEPNILVDTIRIINEATIEGLIQATDEGTPLPDEVFLQELKSNNEVFAAFRTHQFQTIIASKLLDEKGKLRSYSAFQKEALRYTHDQDKRHLQTEYNTAVMRAHHAADWKQFEAEKDVLPNLEWVPSTSSHPGRDHQVFWGTILPLEHVFWNQHRPGDRWNCKCRLRNTDAPATAVPTFVDPKDEPSIGLENNPGKDAQLFSDKHPYFSSSCAVCPFNSGKLWLFKTSSSKKDCYECQKLQKKIDQAEELQRRERNKKEYKRLMKSSNYFDVVYNSITGGLKATHKKHNLDKVGGKYEKEVQNAGMSQGYKVILENEQDKEISVRYTEGTWNDELFEVAGCETANSNNILRGLKHCASKRKTQIAVLDFPNGGYSEEVMERSLKRYHGLEKQKDGQYLKFKKIICVEGEKIIGEYSL